MIADALILAFIFYVVARCLYEGGKHAQHWHDEQENNG